MPCTSVNHDTKTKQDKQRRKTGAVPAKATADERDVSIRHMGSIDEVQIYTSTILWRLTVVTALSYLTKVFPALRVIIRGLARTAPQ